MDEVEIAPNDVFCRLGMLVVESRIPDVSPKGRIQGPHCPSSITECNTRHLCSAAFLCKQAEALRSQMAMLWRNRIPMCIEVLMFKDCVHGAEFARRLDFSLPPNVESCILLEQWTILVSPRRPGEHYVRPKELFQAVRSYLFFSQLSAWLNLTNGRAPQNITFRISPPGEFCTNSFSEAPEWHTFPVSAVGRNSALKITTGSLPRRRQLISMKCPTLGILNCHNEVTDSRCDDHRTQRGPPPAKSGRKSKSKHPPLPPEPQYSPSPTDHVAHRKSPPVLDESFRREQRRHYHRTRSEGSSRKSPPLELAPSESESSSPEMELPSPSKDEEVFAKANPAAMPGRASGAIPKKSHMKSSLPKNDKLCFDHPTLSACNQMDNFTMTLAPELKKPLKSPKVLLTKKSPGQTYYQVDEPWWSRPLTTADSTDSDQSSPEIDRYLKNMRTNIDPLSPEEIQTYLASLSIPHRRTREPSPLASDAPNSQLPTLTKLDMALSQCHMSTSAIKLVPKDANPFDPSHLNLPAKRDIVPNHAIRQLDFTSCQVGSQTPNQKKDEKSCLEGRKRLSSKISSDVTSMPPSKKDASMSERRHSEMGEVHFTIGDDEDDTEAMQNGVAKTTDLERKGHSKSNAEPSMQNGYINRSHAPLPHKSKSLKEFSFTTSNRKLSTHESNGYATEPPHDVTNGVIAPPDVAGSGAPSTGSVTNGVEAPPPLECVTNGVHPSPGIKSTATTPVRPSSFNATLDKCTTAAPLNLHKQVIRKDSSKCSGPRRKLVKDHETVANGNVRAGEDTPENESRPLETAKGPEKTKAISPGFQKGHGLLKSLMKEDLSKQIQDQGVETSQPRPIPSAQEKAAFQKSVDNCANMLFHSKTGLPLQSSPAPSKKKTSYCFEFDCSLSNPRAIKSSISCVNLDEQNKKETDENDNESPHRFYSTSAPASTNSLLGNFEESLLNGRIDPSGVVEGFTATIGASGSFCPKHVTLPVNAFFFNLSDDNAPSPYLGHINLRSELVGKRGYFVPKKGTVQVTLFNPNKTVVKMFVVIYDMSDMPPNCQTFLRQRTLYMPVRGSQSELEGAPIFLRYLIHLRFASSKTGKIFLHTDIRLIFAREKLEYDSRVANYELRSFTEAPTNPKFSPKR